MQRPPLQLAPLLLFLLTAAPLACAALPSSAKPPARVMTSCYMCHSTHGDDPRFGYIPRLAHQSETYITEQLKAFRDGSRSDPPGEMYMWPVSQALSNRDIDLVADWYASQPPPPPQKAGRLAQAGSLIFHDGLLKQDVPACMSCHGPEAAGSGIYPRLAGQNVEYLIEQLRFFKSGVRHDKNADIMHMIAIHLTDRQMRAVADYLTSLQ
ncbi:MAG: c-type cytochrome [Gammaproteobacteria bacterium]